MAFDSGGIVRANMAWHPACEILNKSQRSKAKNQDDRSKCKTVELSLCILHLCFLFLAFRRGFGRRAGRGYGEWGRFVVRLDAACAQMKVLVVDDG